MCVCVHVFFCRCGEVWFISKIAFALCRQLLIQFSIVLLWHCRWQQQQQQQVISTFILLESPWRPHQTTSVTITTNHSLILVWLSCVDIRIHIESASLMHMAYCGFFFFFLLNKTKRSELTNFESRYGSLQPLCNRQTRYLFLRVKSLYCSAKKWRIFMLTILLHCWPQTCQKSKLNLSSFYYFNCCIVILTNTVLPLALSQLLKAFGCVL